MPSRTRKIQSSPSLVTRNRCTRAMQSDKNKHHESSQKGVINHLYIYLYFCLFSRLLTSTLGVGTFLLHRGCKVRFCCLLISSLFLHVWLTPVPLPAVIAVMSLSTVVSILTMATTAMSHPPMAAVMVAMFLDLSLCQQACGLPSARASLVLLVLPIELTIN